MPNIVYPFTFIPNTLAKANEVNANFNAVTAVVNGGIDNTNIAPGAGISLSKLALNEDATFTGNITFDNLFISGPGAGRAQLTYANSPTDRLFTIPDPGSNAQFVLTEGAQSINGVKTFNDNVIALSRLVFDADLDSSFRSDVDDQVLLELGAVDKVVFKATSTDFLQQNIEMDQGFRLILDGSNTSIRAIAVDRIVCETGGFDKVEINTSGIAVEIGTRVILDGFSGNTSIRSGANDEIDFELGGNDLVNINTAGELLLPNISPPSSNSRLVARSGVKAWGAIDDAGVFNGQQFNVVNPMKNGTGDYTVSFDQNYGSTDACVVVCVGDHNLSNEGYATTNVVTTGLFNVRTFNNLGALADRDVMFASMGI